jgi:hypothetical protein
MPSFQLKTLENFGFSVKSLLRDQKMVMQRTVWKKLEIEIMKFEKKGDSVEGILKSKETNQTIGNEVYTLERDDKNPIKVFGTTIIQSQLNSVDIGTKIKIVYMGEGKAKAGQNAVKLFDIYTG